MEGFNGVEDVYGTDVSTDDDTSSSDSGTDAEADEMESTDNADDVSGYSIDSFIQDSQAAGRIYKYEAPERNWNLWVFWREDNGQDRIPHPSPTSPGGLTIGDPATIKDKIRIALSKVNLCFLSTPVCTSSLLVQFWAPIKVGDQCFLSTSDQPFGLNHILHKGLCDYRRNSETYRFNVDEEEENSSLPGRVFRYEWPECTPNVRYYSIEEHPLLKYAESGKIRSSLAVPIYEKSSRLCVGVLELVYTDTFGIIFDDEYYSLIRRIYGAFEMVGLESTYMCYISELEKNPKRVGNICQEAKEIQRVLNVAGIREEIRLAQTWVTCKHEKALDSTCAEDLLFILDDLYYENDNYDIGEFREFTIGHPMRKCHGVVGKALLARKPSFCEDVTKFSISDYPWAHYARDCGLASCFAIPLLSTYSPSESYYIIELFLQPSDMDSGVPQTLLTSILSMMRQELKCLKVASAEEQAEGFPFQVITSYRNDECAASTMHQTSTLPYVSEAIQQNTMQVEDLVSRPNELLGGYFVIRTDKRNVDGPDQRNMVAAISMADEQGEGFPFQVITSYRNDECAPSIMHHQTSTLPYVSQAIQRNRMHAEDPVSRHNELIGEYSVIRTDKANGDGPDQGSIVAATSMEGTHAVGLQGEFENNKEVSFSYEVLQQQFGKKLTDAAKHFKVSPSTLKRVCRDVGIKKWPYSRRIKGSHSPPNSNATRFVRPSKKRMVQPIKEVSSYPDLLPSEGTTAHVVVTATQKSAKSVIIKAKYGDDTLKFLITLARGVLKNLVENVTKRLNLDARTFRLKYRDNKDDLILIACDDDVRECINYFKSSGESQVRILVSPTTTQAP